MRIKRSLQLYNENATVHLYWRCHNKEFYLSNNKVKDLYFNCLEEGLEHRPQNKSEKLRKNCQIHSYCAMNNHFHQVTSYSNGSEHLSLFMRQAHTLFGIRFNKATKRSGCFGNGRPNTPLIQNSNHEMRVHFYVEANPVRAKLCKIENLQDYPYSSYGYYAFGKKTRHTNLLTIPKWYLDLGKTARVRQTRYRKLFRDYLGERDQETTKDFQKIFIGEYSWIETMKILLKSKIELKHSIYPMRI